MPDRNGFPTWNVAEPEESLLLTHRWAVDRACERIAWYRERSNARKRYSQGTRILAVVFGAAGALCPLIDATGIFASDPSAAVGGGLGKWGYVLFALAAAIVGFDRYFGLSAGWMRFMVTQLSLEKVLQEFHYDWVILLARAQDRQPPQRNMVAMLQRVKDFSLQVEALVKQETDAWVSEFQRSLAELEKVLKTEVETKHPGSIRLTVANAKEFDKVVVRLNDHQVKELVGVSEGLIDAVPPKRYELTAVGVKDGKERKESKVVDVQPNAMASLEIKLP